MASAVKIFNHFDTPKKVGVYHRLICLTGDDKGKAFFIVGKRIVMGRSENCDVVVLDLKSSREHAEIILVGKHYILTDLGSQNGIVVNDLKVKQHTLINGDKIIIGKTVYKFSKVEVKDTEQLKSKSGKSKKNKGLDEDFYDNDLEEEPKNKKLTIIMGAIIFLAVILLLSDDSGDEPKKKKKVGFKIQQRADSSFVDAIKIKTAREKKSRAKLEIYINRGVREYREGNYFRAISQFESALQILPNDANANHLLRKARESLDEEITSYFNKATRDTDAVNYMKAKTSYCAVIRLLHRYPTDARYLSALEGVKSLEIKMGMEEGEIVCVEPKGN